MSALPPLQPMGDAAFRFELPEGLEPASALAALRALPGVVDAVVADGRALVRFAPGAPPGDPRPALALAPAVAPDQRRLHEIRTRYDGPDFEEVARQCGLAPDELVALHAGRDYEVQLVGFLPGFAYLGPLDPRLRVARRDRPRPRVPALSVGVAAGRTGIYPFASPGGWHLVGRVLGFHPFDPRHGARLRLGDRVRFLPE